MTTLLTGVILVTGEHGTGKTRFSLEAGDLTRTCLVDDDLKGRGTVNGIKRDLQEFDKQIGEYIDFIELCQGKKRIDVHQIGLEIIDSIPAGKYDVLVWDTWTRFAETCATYVQNNNHLFRDKWAAMGKIKAGEEFKEARNYEANLIARLQKKVPLVILTSHLKNQYLNNAPTGKEIPAVSKTVERVCNLRLWLRHNPASSTPIGLVLKNIEKNVLLNNRLRTVQVLPTKITPLNTADCFESSLWDSIERYLAEPLGKRKANTDETPNEFENSIVQGTLTADQRLSWQFALKQKLQDEANEKFLLEQTNKEKAITLKSEGKKLNEIAAELNASITDIIKWTTESA